MHTRIAQQSDSLLREAVERELKRNGQIFYLHNRVATIHTQAKRLQDQFPDARIAVGHGKLSEETLQSVMEQLDHGKIDILVCTTIVENGLDVPNVNTLIVHDSTQFGLSQLYQLRGRIGRSDRHAYALFFYQRESLKGAAKERLKALQEAQKLGSGFALATRDLEIRGAGNLLGKEQSGHMNTIGITLYARLLQQAMTQHASGTVAPLTRHVTVELPVETILPASYIEDIEDRMTTYQRWSVAAMHGLRYLLAESQRTAELHGELPEPSQQLLQLLRVKSVAYKMPIRRIDTQRDRKGKSIIHVTFHEPPHPRHVHGFIVKHPVWSAPNAWHMTVPWDELGGALNVVLLVC